MRLREQDNDVMECDGVSSVKLCEKAEKILHEALDLHPDKLQEEVEEVENIFSKLRDCLIALLREDARVMPLQQSRWRKPLDHVNVAISLVTGIVYPSAGIHRVRMEEARDMIEKAKEMLGG
jgi:hypothetical protein